MRTSLWFWICLLVQTPQAVSLAITISAVLGTGQPIFGADVANYARVRAHAFNFVRIVEGQKLDAAIVDGELVKVPGPISYTSRTIDCIA
jgi:hypothetical protein